MVATAPTPAPSTRTRVTGWFCGESPQSETEHSVDAKGELFKRGFNFLLDLRKSVSKGPGLGSQIAVKSRNDRVPHL